MEDGGEDTAVCVEVGSVGFATTGGLSPWGGFGSTTAPVVDEVAEDDETAEAVELAEDEDDDAAEAVADGVEPESAPDVAVPPPLPLPPPQAASSVALTTLISKFLFKLIICFRSKTCC
jgi:hypothetical protein